MLFKASDTLFSRLSKKILSHYFYCKKLELGVFNVYHELPDYSRVHTVFRLHDGYFYYYPTNYYTCLKKIQVTKSSFLPCQFIKINPDLNGNQWENSILKLWLIWRTDYRHTKAKSLILCRPNSNPSPKYLFGMWI